MTLVDKILQEAADDYHALERLFQRFLNVSTITVGYEKPHSVGNYVTVGQYDLPDEFKMSLSKNLEVVRKYNFPKNKSYGVKLCDLNINVGKVRFYSKEAMEACKGKTLIAVGDEHSNGNVVYAIVRANTINTIYFGKSYVPQDAAKMRVDAVVKVDTILKGKVH